MDLINDSERTYLLEERSGVHISFFMPLSWEPDEREGNYIRLKNLIKEAERRLTADGFLPPEMSAPDTQQLLQPVRELLLHGRLAVRQGRGLAIFLTPEEHRIYTSPVQVDEMVVVGPRFHIRPVLPFFNPDGRFYLLALSQNQAQLWQGTQISLEAVEIPALPEGLRDALALEDPERSLQFHTSTEEPVGGVRPAVFHGHDANKEKKGAILRYFQVVNKALEEQLAGEDIPLLIASVPYLWPIFEEVNSYPHLLPTGINGNPDHLSNHELHAQAWPIIQSLLEEARDTAVQQYLEGAGSEKTSQSVARIVPAAVYGQVDTLLVAASGQKHGRFIPDTDHVELCETDDFDCEDLVNLTATATLRQGGAVYIVPPEEMPEGKAMAAIFRYVSSIPEQVNDIDNYPKQNRISNHSDDG